MISDITDHYNNNNNNNNSNNNNSNNDDNNNNNNNNNNVITTISRHIDNPGILRTVFSGIFRHIQGHSSIFSHVQTY